MSENDAAPVSHQKQAHQNATNAIEIVQNRGKINEPDRNSVAHNGLVAGSSPAGPTTLRPSGYAWRSQAGPKGEASVNRQKSDEVNLAFMISMVKSIKPRDSIEAMLVAQMVSVHVMAMRCAAIETCQRHLRRRLRRRCETGE